MPLRSTAAVSATNAGITKKKFGSVTMKLIILKWEMNDIIKINKFM